MKPRELKAIVLDMYGADNGGQRKLAADVRVNEVTVSRWATGKRPVQPPEERLIRIIYLLFKEKIRWRKAVYDAEEGKQPLEDML